VNLPVFFGLPSAKELSDAPQRAVLAALDANLVLAVRALQASHHGLHCYDTTRHPLPLLAEAIVACALSLHDVLATYDDLARRASREDCDDSSFEDGGEEADIPF
jgi:hypothetical protein